jgi:hypothetical protein
MSFTTSHIGCDVTAYRSALKWVLDQYKELSDPTIVEKFNTYCFADHKAHVIELLKRLCTGERENQELTTLRDWLLPMLMNGQVVVGEAEEKVPPSRSAAADNGLAMAAEGAGGV